MIVTTIPNSTEPAYTVWWIRDGCRLYHTLINQLMVSPFNEDAQFLRTQIDNSIRALARSQQVVSIAGNLLTGGLDEPVFDIHVGAIMDPTKRFGSPAAGESRLSNSHRPLLTECGMKMGQLFVQSSISSMLSGSSNRNGTMVLGWLTSSGLPSTSTSNGSLCIGIRARKQHDVLSML